MNALARGENEGGWRKEFEDGWEGEEGEVVEGVRGGGTMGMMIEFGGALRVG